MKHIDIKRALTEHNMTQVQLGEKMGVAPQSLTSVIKGNPTVKKLEDVAIAIGCDIIDLFFDDTEGIEEKKMLNGETNLPDPLEQRDSPTAPMGLFTGLSASGDHTSPLPSDDHAIKLPPAQDIMPVTTFCPHCGKRVRVGVVLLPEED